jgi:hypothetical protein
MKSLVILLVLAILATVAGAQCPPVSDETLESLTLGRVWQPFELAPGRSIDFDLRADDPGAAGELYDGCAEWTIHPRGYVHVDAVGVVRSDANAPDGWHFSVIANVGRGRRILAVSGLIYDPAAHPLVRTWREEARYDCESGRLIDTEERIGELHFRADGTFAVTRLPFESYVDYWGRYVADSKTRRLLFEIRSGNVIPERVKNWGSYRLTEDGRLIIEGVSFGTVAGDRKRACRYVFR